MNTVFIVPTGIGASIGGDAGDATPAFKLIASMSGIAITHPNVVNASDINEMPENTWYVEGSILDRFMNGHIKLRRPYSNRILLVTNKPVRPETVNAMGAARHTIGCDVELLELDAELRMIASMDKNENRNVIANESHSLKLAVSSVSFCIQGKRSAALIKRNETINPKISPNITTEIVPI